MGSFDWRSAVQGIAPILGGAFGGPLGAAATGALVNAVLGDRKTGDPVKDEASLASVLSGGITPEVRLKIIEAETEIKRATMEYADKAQARELEQAKAQLADVQSARERDVQLAKAGRKNQRANVMVAIDAAGLVLGLGGLIALGWFQASNPGSLSEGVFGALIAQLATITSYFGLCLRDAHQFEFGSSRGSKDKDDVIGALKGASSKAPPPPA
jgi:hypothetical protein